MAATVDLDTQERLQAAYAEAREGGGGGGGGAAGMNHYPELSNLSNEASYQLAKQMLNAGRAADPSDSCARIAAIYDTLESATNEPRSLEERAEVLRECRAQPRYFSGCLKAESERTPAERRRCARLMERDPFGSAEAPGTGDREIVRPPSQHDVPPEVRRARARLRAAGIDIPQ